MFLSTVDKYGRRCAGYHVSVGSLDSDAQQKYNNINKKKTFYGSTSTVTIPKLFAQGDLMAPQWQLCRCLQGEDTEREEEERETLRYRYKGTVPSPCLGLMDDSAIITEVGYKSEIVNVFMNESSAENNLQFNEKKCKYLKLGKNTKVILNRTLEMDTRKKTYDSEDNFIEKEGGGSDD